MGLGGGDAKNVWGGGGGCGLARTERPYLGGSSERQVGLVIMSTYGSKPIMSLTTLMGPSHDMDLAFDYMYG
jgi:hypothetical protein